MLLILVQLEQLEWAATATNRTVYVSPIQHFLQPSFVNHDEISQKKIHDPGNFLVFRGGSIVNRDF